MFKGDDTTKIYEECLQAGLCKEHIKEFEVTSRRQKSELQRKALLYVRLQIFAPLLFNKPFISEKMKALLSMSKYFPDRDNGEQERKDFKETILLLDAVVIFTLCHFSKVCCAGALFESSRLKCINVSKNRAIYHLLIKKKLDESDISCLNPILQENFRGHDVNLIKICYVTALLFVRNVSHNLKLKPALQYLENEFQKVAKEGENWSMIGSDAYKKDCYEEAVNAFTSSLKFNPYDIKVLNNRAQAYMKLGKFRDSALDSYIILMIEPFSMHVFYDFAYSLLLQQLYFECFLVAEFAVEKFKHNRVDDPEGYSALEKIKDDADLCVNNKFASHVDSLEAKYAAKHEVPKLVEAPNSETVAQDVPDLVEASNSEDSDSESEPPNIIMKFPKSLLAMEKQPSPEEIKTEPVPQKVNYKNIADFKRDQMKTLLRDASLTLLDGCGLVAIRSFRDILDEIKSLPLIIKFEECDIVCIKYAYGFANCKSGGYDDLLKGISVFKDLLQEHNAIMFPAAYYGIGFAYRKLNRFKDALQFLYIIKDILEKGIHFKTYTWPGLTTVIDESKRDFLKNIVYEMINECEIPPPPNATCRFEQCSLQPSIYYTDPDFKGFFFIQCSEQCCFQYHPPCWKVIKTSHHCSDKEFLEKNCLTPDCEGIITKIQNIGREGTIAKMFIIADSKKVVKHKKSKLEKKLEVKEEKRRKRKDSTNKSESISETQEETQSENSPEPENAPVIKEVKKESKERKNDNQQASSVSILSANAEPFVIFKKEKLLDENMPKNSTKSKDQKKVKNNTYTIDEFLEISNDKACNQYQQRLKSLRHNNQNQIGGVSPWALCNESTVVPPHPLVSLLDTSIPVIEKKVCPPDNFTSLVLDSSITIKDAKCIKENIYSFFKELLHKHGPLRIDDPIIVEELKSFPSEANVVIADSHSIGDFLKQNIEFALVGETYVCLVDDVVSAYNMYARSSVTANGHNDLLDDCDYPSENETELDTFCGFLNPDAVEYTPPNASCISFEGSSTDDLAAELKMEKVNRNSSTLISAISKLRQPLTVDEGIAIKSKTASEDQIASRAVNSDCLNLIPSHYSQHLSISDPSLDVTLSVEKSADVNTMKMSQRCSTSNEHTKPYSVVKLPKTTNKSIQTDINEEQKETKLVKKFDEELQRLKEIVNLLNNDKHNLLEQIKLLEEKHELVVDSAIKFQNKSAVETSTLKNELQGLYLTFEDERKEFKNKESKMEKDIRLLSETLQNAGDDNLAIKAKNDELTTNNKSLQTRLQQMEENVNVLQDENNSNRKDLEQQQINLKDRLKINEKEKLEALERAKTAELMLLQFNKTEYLKRIDTKTAEAAQRMKELQNGISLCSGGLNPVFTNNIEALLTQIKNYISKLGGIRIDFTVRIDEQINDVNNGTTLLKMKPLEIKELPEIPSWAYQPPNSNVSPNAQSPSWNSQLQMLNSCFNAANFNPLNYSQLNNISTMKPDPLNLQVNKQINMQHETPLQSPVGMSGDFSKPDVNPFVPPLPAKKRPPGLNPVPNIPAVSTSGTNSPSTMIPKVLEARQPQQTEVKKTSSVTADARRSELSSRSSATLELGYNVNKSKPKDGVSPSASSSTLSSQEKLSSTAKNCYTKLLQKLQIKYPTFTQSQLMDVIGEFRKKKGSLSGLNYEMLIGQLGALLESKFKGGSQATVRSKSHPLPPFKVLVNKKIVLNQAKGILQAEETSTEKKRAWGKNEQETSKPWSGNCIGEECTICCEEMTLKTAYKVDCGHIFHLKCIREWLNKKSDCPICRLHLLLPEDYPTLS